MILRNTNPDQRSPNVTSATSSIMFRNGVDPERRYAYIVAKTTMMTLVLLKQNDHGIVLAIAPDITKLMMSIALFTEKS